MPVSSYGNKKKKKGTRARLRKYWWLAPVLGGVAILGWLATGPRIFGPRVLSRTGAPIKGYVSDIQTLRDEYKQWHGKKLDNPQLEQRFQMVNDKIALQDYESAALLLENVAQQAALPVVYNNLGVVYAQLNDSAHAIGAFREALARDIDYKPVRLNLDRLRNMTANAADPVTREIEDNSTPANANIISLNRAVEGEIETKDNDLDYFRVTTPPAPRDRLLITVEPHTPLLSLVLRLYDSDRRVTDMASDVRQSGQTLSFIFAPTPNTTYYLQISGSNHTSGSYTLKVSPLHAYDGYEPNDDIFNAKRVEIAQEIMANIMDGTDEDYYSFIAPRTGQVNVTVRNRSTTLIPALTTYSPEMRNIGFGPDLRTPGATLRHTFDVVENQTYYLQVWSENSTSGDYSLIVE
jgi:tetratricopeptide (TPR) repeat protein